RGGRLSRHLPAGGLRAGGPGPAAGRALAWGAAGGGGLALGLAGRLFCRSRLLRADEGGPAAGAAPGAWGAPPPGPGDGELRPLGGSPLGVGRRAVGVGPVAPPRLPPRPG